MTTDLIFDFFGTLVNYDHGLTGKDFTQSHAYLTAQGFSISYQAFLDGWNAAFDKLEAQAQMDYHEYHMCDAARTFFTDTFQANVGRSTCDHLVAQFIEEWNRGVTYIPDIKTFLTALSKDYRLSIISNTHYSPLIDNHLAAMDMNNLFQAVTKSVEHGLRKPHPQIFADTLDELGISAQRAIYVGDSFSSDYQGAKSVGLRPILIDTGRQYLNLGTERVDHLFDIQNILLH